MALSLSVSKETRQRLAKLGGLTDDGFDELLEFMRSQAEQFASLGNVREAASGLQHCASEAADIVHAVMPLLLRHVSDGRTPSEVTAAVLAAYKRNPDPDLLVNAKDVAIFKKRLLAILADNQIALKTKAMALVGERSAVLHQAKIISDVRPVFASSKSKIDAVEAFSIIHTLVLTYVQDGEYVKSFVALDSADLTSLKEIIDRAQSKERALSKFLEASAAAKIVIA